MFGSEVKTFNRSRLLSATLYKALNLNCGPFVKQISTCRLSKVISDLNAVFRNNPSVIISYHNSDVKSTPLTPLFCPLLCSCHALCLINMCDRLRKEMTHYLVCFRLFARAASKEWAGFLPSVPIFDHLEHG